MQDEECKFPCLWTTEIWRRPRAWRGDASVGYRQSHLPPSHASSPPCCEPSRVCTPLRHSGYKVPCCQDRSCSGQGHSSTGYRMHRPPEHPRACCAGISLDRSMPRAATLCLRKNTAVSACRRSLQLPSACGGGGGRSIEAPQQAPLASRGPTRGADEQIRWRDSPATYLARQPRSSVASASISAAPLEPGSASSTVSPRPMLAAKPTRLPSRVRAAG